MDIRKAHVSRKTSETDIEISICLDGTGECDADTGIGFFDHMLNSFARHGLFDLSVKVRGDLYVDGHHTIEDTGIVLGEAIQKALGDKKGIRRFGYFILPMDETLVLASLDLSGRPEMVREFFYAISYSCGMNLHLKLLDGTNNHHIIEAAFKAFAKSLDMAAGYDERIKDVLSTKGSL